MSKLTKTKTKPANAQPYHLSTSKSTINCLRRVSVHLGSPSNFFYYLKWVGPISKRGNPSYLEGVIGLAFYPSPKFGSLSFLSIYNEAPNSSSPPLWLHLPLPFLTLPLESPLISPYSSFLTPSQLMSIVFMLPFYYLISTLHPHHLIGALHPHRPTEIESWILWIV